MKTLRIMVAAILLSGGAAAIASAASVSIEAGGVAYLFNSLSSSQGTGAITNSPDFSPDPYVNASYTLGLDQTTKLKLGLMAEDMMGTISPSFIQIARAEPYADLSWGSLSARVSFPLYLLGYDTTNDAKYTEIKFVLDKYYKGINLGTYYNSTNTFLTTNYESLAYKVSLDKTTSLTFSATTEIGLVPALWVYDVKPQVTVVWGPLQLDAKESIYFSDQNQNPSPSDVKYNVRVFTDPKLTLNFQTLGVPGLKAFFAASLFTYNVYPNSTLANDAVFYGGASTGTGAQAVALGSSITPGVSFAVGPFYAEADFKVSNYDDSVNNVAKKDPTFDPSVKLSYTLAF